jgi:arylformamidase
MYDLTQPLNAGIPRFPGDPEVHIETIHELAPWQISSLRMGTHSGTHMDAPPRPGARRSGIG